MFVQPALLYDAARQRCDLAFDGVDLALDLTPATPLLVSIGTDRRAHADDALPDIVTDDYAPSRLNARRGWAGDALDAQGRLTGSRVWLIARAKQTEATRLLAQGAAAEALAWFEAAGYPVQLTVRWVARGVLGIWARLGTFEAAVQVPA